MCILRTASAFVYTLGPLDWDGWTSASQQQSLVIWLYFPAAGGLSSSGLYPERCASAHLHLAPVFVCDSLPTREQSSGGPGSEGGKSDEVGSF